MTRVRPTCRASSRSPSARSPTRPASPRRRAAERASAGTTTCTTCTRAASGSSGPATTRISSPRGCRRSRAWWRSWSAARSWRMSAVATARERAESAGVADRVRFEVAPASSYAGAGYDLVTMFDCLHDMGDPVGAARHVRSTLAPDGTWMIVEPFAGDRVEDNLTPVGRAYYAFSTLLCTPASLSQEVGLALGAQAGEARIRDVVEKGGFTRFRRVAETPFNLVFEARP